MAVLEKKNRVGDKQLGVYEVMNININTDEGGCASSFPWRQ